MRKKILLAVLLPVLIIIGLMGAIEDVKAASISNMKYYIDSLCGDIDYKGNNGTKVNNGTTFAKFTNTEYSNDIWVKYEYAICDDEGNDVYDLVIYPKAIDGWCPYLSIGDADGPAMYEELSDGTGEHYYALKLVVTKHKGTKTSVGDAVAVDNLFVGSHDIDLGEFVAYTSTFSRDTNAADGSGNKYDYITGSSSWMTGFKKYEGKVAVSNNDYRGIVVGLIDVPTTGFEVIYGVTPGGYNFGSSLWAWDVVSNVTKHKLTINANGGTYTIDGSDVSKYSKSKAANKTFTVISGTTKYFTPPTGYKQAATFLTKTGGGTWSSPTYTYGSSDGTITANWDPIQYTVTYNANAPVGTAGGTAVSAQTFYHTSTAATYTPKSATIKANTWTVTGYTFNGWNTAANGTGTSYAVGAVYNTNANLTLYAQWKAVTYTVTYNANAPVGTTASGAVTAQTFYHTSTAAALTPKSATIKANTGGFAVAGYTFNGWNTAANGTGTSYAVGAVYNTNANLTLYAQWKPITYTVTYNGNAPGDRVVSGGLDPQTFYDTRTAAALTPKSATIKANTGGFVLPGYIFKGWNTAANGTGTTYAAGTVYNTNANLILYAQWEPVQYTVSYISNAPTANLHEGPVTSHKFYDTRTEDKYQPKSVTIKENTWVVDGYKFIGWNGAADGSGTSYMPGDVYNENQNIVLYAQWEPIKYKVTYYDNAPTGNLGGTPVAVQEFYDTRTEDKYQPKSVTISECSWTVDGYTFTKWMTNDDTDTTFYPGDTYNVNADISLYAQWDPNIYKVTYDANPPAGLTADGTAVTGHSFYDTRTEDKYQPKFVYIKQCTWSVKGYEFDGWSEEPDGTADDYAYHDVYDKNKSVKLYAQWRPIEYMVSYHPNAPEGESVAGSAVEAQYFYSSYTGADCEPKSVNISANSWSIAYHKFKSWNTQPDGTGQSYLPGSYYSEDHNLELYAQWERIEHTVTYKANYEGGGTDVSDEHLMSGKAYKLRGEGTFKRNGWKLMGWSDVSGPENTVKADYGLDATIAKLEQDLVLYAVWQPSITVSYDGGFSEVKVLDTPRESGSVTYHPYNTKILGFSIKMKSGYHFNSIDVNGMKVSDAASLEKIIENTDNGIGLLQAPLTIYLHSSPNGSMKPSKDVFKNGTSSPSVDGSVVKSGDKLDYVIKVRNNGTVVRDVRVEDGIDSGLTYTAGSADNGGTYSGGKIVWNLSNVLPGQEKTLKYSVTANDKKIGDKVVNKADSFEAPIAALGESSESAESSETRTNYVIGQPLKHLRKSADATTTIDSTVLSAGEKAVYTIEITNPAPVKKSFKVTDVVPKGLKPVSASDSGKVSGQTVVWDSISIDAGLTKMITIDILVEEIAKGDTLKNEADVTCLDVFGTSIKSTKTENFALKESQKSVYPALDDNLNPNTDTSNVDGQVINDGILLTYRIGWVNPTNGKRTIKISDTVPEFARIATAADLDLASDGVSLAEKFNYIIGDIPLITNNGTYDSATNTVNWEFESTSISDDNKDSGYVEYTVVVLKTAQNKHVLNTAKVTVVSPAGLHENDPTVETNTVDNPVLETPTKKAVRDNGGIEEDVSNLVVGSGEGVTYKITFENPSDEPKNFIVTDKVPDYTELIEGSISDGGIYDSATGVITWSLSAVAANSSKTVSFAVNIEKDVPAGESVKNTARVRVDLADKMTQGDNPVKVYVLSDPTKAVLNIDGEDIDGVVKRQGDIITYNIVYRNPVDEESVATIKDELPGGLQILEATHQGSFDAATNQFVEDVSDGYSSYFDADSNTVVWTVPTAAGCQEMVSVKARILPEACGNVLVNRASIYIPDAEKWTNDVSTPVVKNPVKTAVDEKGQLLNDNVVTVGQTFTYCIEVENPADEPKAGHVTDRLPTGVTFVSSTMKGRYDVNNHTVMWRNLQFASHEKKVVTVTVKVNEDAACETINNEAVFRIDDAQVSTSLEDFGPGGAKDYVAVKSVLDTKANNINKKTVAPGNTLVYRIDYANVSEHERFFTIFDALPEGVDIVSIGDGGSKISQPIEGLEGYKISPDRTVAWNFYVAPKAEGYVTLTVKVNTNQMGQVIKNRAAIMIQDDENPDLAPYVLGTNYVENPCIEVPVKTVWNEEGREITDKMVHAGEVITYKITYKNSSDETKYADIRDSLPVEVEFVSCDYDGFYDAASHYVKWTNIETAAGERATVSVIVKVKENAGGKTIQNKGTLKMDSATVSTYAKTPASDPNEPSPDMKNPWVKNYVTCKKSYDANGNDISGGVVKVGDSITYRIFFKNTSSKEKNYTITDVLPDEVDYVSATGEPGIAGKELSWTATLKAGGEQFFDVVVTVNKDGKGKIIKNHAGILENDPDSEEDPYAVVTADVVNPVFADDFTKSVMDKKGKDINNKVVSAGDNLYYHIKLHNPSEQNEKFVITDTLAEYLRFVSASKNAKYDESSNTVKWEFELDGDAQEDLEIVVKVKKSADNATIANIAHVVTEGTEMDSNEVDNYLMPAPEKKQEANGAVVPNGGEVKANTTVVYTLTYSNPTKNGRDITITDKLDPAIVDRVMDISDNGKLEGGIITWQIDAEGGESGEVTFTVSSPDLDGYEVHNIATVSMDDDNMTGPTTQDTNEVYFVARPDERVSSAVKGTESDPRKNPANNIVKTGDALLSLLAKLFE